MRSIRTRFGLVTALLLLSLLGSFYLGGRFILVHMLRQAEENARIVSGDIKRTIYDELGNIRASCNKAAIKLPRSRSLDETAEFLRYQLADADTHNALHLAVALDAKGRFVSGYFMPEPNKLNTLSDADLAVYHSPLLTAIDEGRITSGLVSLRDNPMFFAMCPTLNEVGEPMGFLLLGTLCKKNHSIIKRINDATSGMRIRFTQARQLGQRGVTGSRGASGSVPSARPDSALFKDLISYGAGGDWHLGENLFEAVLPLTDILGTEVLNISINMPQTFSSLASNALGWLTSFTALVGILFVAPMLWLQSRILLNPLTQLACQIQEIGQQGVWDGQGARVIWRKKDEFGILADNVNGMLDALLRNTKHIRAQDRRILSLIAGIPDCLCIFNRHAKLITIHKQPDYTLPIPGLVTDRPIAPPIFPDTDCEALRDTIAEAFRSSKVQMVMVSCREPDGSYRHFETRVNRLDEESALVVWRDVTREWRERETREQMETRLSKVDKMESLTTLAAGIAHDVNNVLTIIQNTVESEEESQVLPAESREAITTIKQATSKGSMLMRELMNYAGHVRMDFMRVNPNQLIIDLENLMSGMVASNISLDINLAPDLPFIQVDPHQFWKVIINLLKNASESMGGNSGRIRLRTYNANIDPLNVNDFFSTQTLKYGHGVVFQIDDTGCGIPPQALERLYEPFFSTKSMGRGLGLATVFGIVDSHNGGISISSKVGKGTTFRIWLPVAMDQSPLLPTLTASDDQARQDTASDTAGDGVGEYGGQRSACVLLIDDDPIILRATTALLRSLNVTVLSASTQREALSLFRHHADNISLALLDAQLGRFDNVKLLNVLRLRKPDLRTIIISGYDEERIRKMFASVSYDGFLKKPYTRVELSEMLAKHIMMP